MTDSFAPQVLSIKADKISNAVTAGLKCGCFGTGNSPHFPCNVALHYYETTTSLPCLNSACAVTWNNPRFNTLNWYCVERTCFWISYSGNAGSNADRIAYTATHTQELFCNISLHGERTVSNHDRFVLQFRANFICCLHTLGYDKIKKV